MRLERLPSGLLVEARRNLAAFVRRGRHDIVALGEDLPFDAPAWDLTRFSQARASSGSRKFVLYFTTSENGNAKGLEGRVPLSEPFAGFIKTVARLRYDANPKVPQTLAVLVRASRYLHDVLADRGYDPCELVKADFDEAAGLCMVREAASSRYRVGVFLAEIADWLNRYSLTKGRITFRNPFPRVAYDGTRLGDDHDDRGKKKLPSPEMLDALSQLANLVESPPDVIRMRAIELLVCGGWRINELLTLPENCEVEEDAFENGRPVLGPDGAPQLRYGIRYQPEKGGKPAIKWLPTPMVDVAKRAVADIRDRTIEGRSVAAWLEANPGQAYLPDGLRDRATLSSRDLEAAFGLVNGTGNQWAKNRKLVPVEVVARTSHYTRQDVEAALLADQRSLKPKNPTSMPLSKHLFVTPLNLFHDQRGTNASVLSLLTDQQIADFLGGRVSDRGAAKSVFERFGFVDENGRPFEMNSHMFRHWLNTMAQQGGMGQHEIARWFGRKDVGQNTAYDHRSAMQMAEEARELLATGKVIGGVGARHDRLPPIERPKFRAAVFATGHTTDLGMCGSDWSLTPCLKHGACGHCEELFIEKGNPDQKCRAETMLEEHEWLLERALEEVAEETFGASNHLNHIRLIVNGLRRIVAVHNDPSIPDGTLVHVNPEGLDEERRQLLGLVPKLA
ncbi:hypothetical protein D3218_03250 [Aureimonas flava]|uniref:Integrase n=1 Tax=Aureimonas flava TaxID=2320271 RepID=A0A3A1WRY1_9HYPH|nr:hypothetical protein D3218_03250 [Aureimonas flava]